MKWLEPDDFSVACARPGFLSLRMANGVIHEDVRCASLFPLTDPNGFVELTAPGAGAGEEFVSLGVIPSLDRLAPDARSLIEAALRRRHIMPEITDIRAVREKADGYEWDIETDRGPWRMLVKRKGESYQMIGENRIVITDTDGTRYSISNRHALSRRSRAALDKVLV